MEDLRCDEARRAARRAGEARLLRGWRALVGFRKAKVDQLHNAVRVKQDVLWLEVAVHDALCMDGLEATRNLTDDIPAVVFRQTAIRAQ